VTVKDIIYFVYDGWQVVEEHEAMRTDDIPPTLSSPIMLVADYVYGIGIDEPLRMRRDLNKDGHFNKNEEFYYHENGIGSIYAITDINGAVVERYDYTTYGVTQVYEPDGITERVVSLVDNPYTFHARRLDSETATVNSPSLLYFRRRIYNPQLQRFLQRDPVMEERGFVYRAFGNSPCCAKDSMGLFEAAPSVLPVGLFGYTSIHAGITREALGVYFDDDCLDEICEWNEWQDMKGTAHAGEHRRHFTHVSAQTALSYINEERKAVKDYDQRNIGKVAKKIKTVLARITKLREKNSILEGD